MIDVENREKIKLIFYLKGMSHETEIGHMWYE
jgi:hypothetical protein